MTRPNDDPLNGPEVRPISTLGGNALAATIHSSDIETAPTPERASPRDIAIAATSAIEREFVLIYRGRADLLRNILDQPPEAGSEEEAALREMAAQPNGPLGVYNKSEPYYYADRLLGQLRTPSGRIGIEEDIQSLEAAAVSTEEEALDRERYAALIFDSALSDEDVAAKLDQTDVGSLLNLGKRRRDGETGPITVDGLKSLEKSVRWLESSAEGWKDSGIYREGYGPHKPDAFLEPRTGTRKRSLKLEVLNSLGALERTENEIHQGGRYRYKGISGKALDDLSAMMEDPDRQHEVTPNYLAQLYKTTLEALIVESSNRAEAARQLLDAILPPAPEE